MNEATSKHAVITGGGSGIGRASALKLAEDGWTLSLLGRRREALQEVADGISGAVSVHSVDVGDETAVAAVFAQIVEQWGRIDALVTAAGMNLPDRSWKVLSTEGYRGVMQANLDGVFHCVHAALPTMRANGGGTVVVINSEAGKVGSAKSGVAYVVSKFGLTGLVQSLNAEERGEGIRAVSIFPGDVNTPLLDRRPVPVPPEKRAAMVQPGDVAACVSLAVNLPARAIVEELVIRPSYG